jgi:hypothetical protein
LAQSTPKGQLTSKKRLTSAKQQTSTNWLAWVLNLNAAVEGRSLDQQANVRQRPVRAFMVRRS